MARITRKDSTRQQSRLLEAIGACRNAVLREIVQAKIGGPLYHSANTVVAAIDGLALMLTGDRTYFWEKGTCPQAKDDGTLN